MRQPCELGARPEASSSTPACASSLWKVSITPISSVILGGNTPVSDCGVALTMIMYRISALLQVDSSQNSWLTNPRRTRPRDFDKNGPGENPRTRNSSRVLVTGANAAHLHGAPLGGRALPGDGHRFGPSLAIDEEEAAHH